MAWKIGQMVSEDRFSSQLGDLVRQFCFSIFYGGLFVEELEEATLFDIDVLEAG